MVTLQRAKPEHMAVIPCNCVKIAVPSLLKGIFGISKEALAF